MRKEAIKRLLVRAPNWIGDAVMCEPALRGLRMLFPASSMTLLAKASVADLFQASRTLDRVVIYEDRGRHAGLSGKWTLAQSLRRQQFDLAILLQNAFEAAFLTWLAGIPRRYGYATDGRTLLLTDPVARPAPEAVTHQVAYYWNLLKPLGVTGPPPQPALIVTDEERAALDARLAASDITPSDFIVGINPGSTYGGAKRWLPERFAEVAQRLSRHIEQERGKNVAVLILGAKGEETLGRDIAARIGNRSVVLSGATTIRELMAATKRCGLLLTNDTGPMHIAAAFNVPLVAIFGPTDWRTTSPYGQEQGLVREPVDCSPCLLRECPIDHRCMTRIPADRVYEASLSSLSGLSRPSGLSRQDQTGQTDRLDQIDEGASLSSLSRLSGLSRQDRTDQKDRIDQIDETDHLSRITHHAPLQGVTIFLDRDGTLNPDPGYIRSPDQFELFPGVAGALARLKRAGAQLIVVTNQSGIARGFLSAQDLERIHDKLRHLLDGAGASLDAVYFCPHHPDEACGCRKPETGMIEQAVRERQIDLARSYFIGDHARDMQLARRIGARSVLVTSGKDNADTQAELAAQHLVPDAVLPALPEAVEWILADVVKGRQPSAVSRQGDAESVEKLRTDS